MIRTLLLLLIVLSMFSCTPKKMTTTNTTPKEQRVRIITDSGDIVIRLYNKTPLHRDNFIKLVKGHYFDSLLFHRVINNFMIQGGDPDSKHAKPGQLLGDVGA